MSRTARKYTAAASLIFVSVMLYMLAAAQDFSSFGLPAIVTAALSFPVGFGLVQTWRWCAYAAFLGMLCGVLLALGGALGSNGAIALLMWLIVLTDSLAALILFGLLWPDRPPAQ